MDARPPAPWPRGAATGVGSLPGESVEDAVRLVFDQLPEFPHLPELPDRGPGADLVGRTAAQLADLYVDLQPSGWRLVGRPGVDLRRARDLLARDLDALEAFGGAFDGPLKVQLAGPWTLVAEVELTRGDKALADSGAVRDVAESLAETVREHVAEVRRRVPGARLVVQLDEPALPAVLAGRVRTASGFAALPAVEAGPATDTLAAVLAAAVGAGATPVVHCCAARPPVQLLAAAGARAVSVDAAVLGPRDDDALGTVLEGGTDLFLGLVPATGPGVPPGAAAVAQPARDLWQRLGFPAERLADRVVVTPACGLAGASAGWVHSALRLCRQAARALDEAPEGVAG